MLWLLLFSVCAPFPRYSWKRMTLLDVHLMLFKNIIIRFILSTVYSEIKFYLYKAFKIIGLKDFVVIWIFNLLEFIKVDNFIKKIFFGCTRGIWKLLGQGSNPSRSCHLQLQPCQTFNPLRQAGNHTRALAEISQVINSLCRSGNSRRSSKVQLPLLQMLPEAAWTLTPAEVALT